MALHSASCFHSARAYLWKKPQTTDSSVRVILSSGSENSFSTHAVMQPRIMSCGDVSMGSVGVSVRPSSALTFLRVSLGKDVIPYSPRIFSDLPLMTTRYFGNETFPLFPVRPHCLL